MDKFIYVFSDEDKAKLIELGLLLLRDDISNKVFIFKSEESLQPSSLDDVEDYMTSDVLLF